MTVNETYGVTNGFVCGTSYNKHMEDLLLQMYLADMKVQVLQEAIHKVCDVTVMTLVTVREPLDIC
jgi:hypothetical protein